MLIIAIFVLGYAAIATEHFLGVNKAGIALITGILIWVGLATGGYLHGPELNLALSEHLSDISGILFFLLGAMTIVELIDAHHGFTVVTDLIHTQNKKALLWGISILTFFLSAVLDNMTTAIIMSALLKKLLDDKEDLWLFGSMVIIAANAGGAWSPIGDVTTIMLWIGGQITAWPIIKSIFLPSLISLLVPLVLASLFMLKGDLKKQSNQLSQGAAASSAHKHKGLILAIGVGILLAVPVFKTYTHLPPYMGILLGVGLLWVITELLHRRQEEEATPLSIAAALTRIDTPSVLFFLGILLAVAGLQAAGYLGGVASWLSEAFGSLYLINGAIGLLSAVVDNVPLVAGAMGMYDLNTFPADHNFWQLLAYCAGTGGSILIIGSAAGVATMGILRIEFFWYARKISLIALAGYLAGIAVEYLMHLFM
ncbi:MAG: sodium:proton antiporter NhaD [Haliscomenobacter sp.]